MQQPALGGQPTAVAWAGGRERCEPAHSQLGMSCVMQKWWHSACAGLEPAGAAAVAIGGQPRPWAPPQPYVNQDAARGCFSLGGYLRSAVSLPPISLDEWLTDGQANGP